MKPLKRTYTIMETIQSTATRPSKEGKYRLMEVVGEELKLIRRSDHLNELETVMLDLSQPQTPEEYRHELQEMRSIMFEIRDDLSYMINSSNPTFGHGELGRLRAIHTTLNEKVKETAWVYDAPSPVFPDTIDEEAELWRK